MQVETHQRDALVHMGRSHIVLHL